MGLRGCKNILNKNHYNKMSISNIKKKLLVNKIGIDVSYIAYQIM